MPGARCTRGLVCNMRIETHTSIQVQRNTPAFPAQGKINSPVKLYESRVQFATH